MEELEDIARYETPSEFMTMRDDYGDPIYVSQASTAIRNFQDSIYMDLRQIPEVACLLFVKQLGLAQCCSSFAHASNSRYNHSLLAAVKLDYLIQTTDELDDLEREMA